MREFAYVWCVCVCVRESVSIQMPVKPRVISSANHRRQQLIR